VSEVIDTNVELRRSMISSALNRHPDAYGFVFYHNYQDGPVITIASRSPRECCIIHGGVHDALQRTEDMVLDHDGEGFYFSGSRLNDDLEAIGLYVVGSFPFSHSGKIQSLIDIPQFIRDRRTEELRVSTGLSNVISTAIFENIVSKLKNSGYVDIWEDDLYLELLLANGAVRSSEHGVCQVATGEYVAQTVCTDCGNKTGVCRASKNFDGILELRNSDLCEKCARKYLTCHSCTYYYSCDRKKVPADCEEFAIVDFDYEDDTLCSCPLGGDGE